MKTTSLRPLALLLGGLLLWLPCSARAADNLISFVDLWLYHDRGIDLGTEWREPGYDHSEWTLGISEFGFGEGDEFTALGSSINTAYFRAVIDVANPTTYSNLSLYLLRDDGAVVYLNGVEVFRNNMPAGTISYGTVATRNIDGDDESAQSLAQRVIPASMLAVGRNVFAVEVHQAAGGNDDMSFALAVLGHRVGENQPPSAFDSFVIAEQDRSTNITLIATDPDNDFLEYALLTFPQHGTLSGVEPNLTYTPNAGYTGPDSFSFRASDGEWNTEIATVSIDVQLVSNHPPTADSQDLSVAEDNSLSITLTANDPDGDALTYTASAPANGTLSGSGNSLVYQPAPNFFGPDSFTFTVDDGRGGSAIGVINITVTPVNDAPTADAQSVTVNEDTAIGIIVTASDLEGDSLSYSFTQPAHGTVNGAGSTAIYQPAANYNGPDSFTFTVDDGNGGFATATISVTVAPINDQPLALARAASASDPTNFSRNLVVVATNNQNATVLLDGMGSSDADGTVLTYAWYEGASATPFSTQASPTVSLPIGSYVITLVVSDGAVTASDTITVQIFTPCEVVKKLTAEVQAADLKPSERNGLLGHLNAACSTFGNGNISAGLHQLELFKARVINKIAPTNSAVAESLNASAQEIIDDVSGQ